ncbi:Fic family protein [Kineococcus arenarius]|uniref:Fic family protein n=1 Tax=Kineococcus sp. SYSU DK007 TaxID=3383128 RepID=UPI003D7E1E85
MALHRTPALDLDDLEVLDQVHALRSELQHSLAAPRRWHGMLRRTMLARAIRGSNSIEGYVVTVDDAVAAVDEEEPLNADARVWAEITGYRSAMSYVLQAARDPQFRYESGSLRGVHFMLLSHDLGKSPGHYRQGPIFVHDDTAGRNVYEGPPTEEVPRLVDELMVVLNDPGRDDVLVRAAMAHLNLVMIHPFRDGNGRMARALQTLVLARESIVEPPFASIEEWLGRNTESYYAILALTGAGAWNPERSAHLWVKFNLRAHHMQAQTVKRRAALAARTWDAAQELVSAAGLPERTTNALFDAASGFRVRRPGYAKLADVENRTATRDLQQLVDAELLVARGKTKGRYYLAGPAVQQLVAEVRGQTGPLDDPYPDLEREVRVRLDRLNRGEDVPRQLDATTRAPQG